MLSSPVGTLKENTLGGNALPVKVELVTKLWLGILDPFTLSNAATNKFLFVSVNNEYFQYDNDEVKKVLSKL